ncbi:MAG: amidohydrolase [Desulfobacula sp.]|jgi:predicted amidohydrolase|uniref:nitrilase-related carbon-nitrogen hydrolase n=1 Tax=Desulfobacula sp. TaxID=2593537 RepID=UPI001D587355|nr:amidohydrolase [Desulfobacula sp.]MBT3484410.1 amidohydrolase [Desulfobacula sp.]MBT3803325.1 amidohydrolase [Desulfobacula sp.]MBT4023709.1 amidohydrolase [Desulfobacula sp.]MBT4197951.1 amidohydrolase [Desulfobacula sp.]
MKIFKAALIVQNCIAGNFEKNLKSTLDLISAATQKGAKFIVFPEMNLTGYVAGSDIKKISRPITRDMVSLFSSLANKLESTILVGLAEKTLKENIYASHLVFNPDKSFEIYRKIHTAPFEKKYFTPGNKIKIFKSQGLKFGIQLCYDAHFPELSLAMALKKVDVIFIPHASPRGSSQEKYESWIRHLRARAFDNTVYIAACNQNGNNTKKLFFPGVSVFIGPDGNVLYKSVTETEGIHIINIKKSVLNAIRSHKMKYFLPHRRSDLFKF